jgi:hypothetical protein
MKTLAIILLPLFSMSQNLQETVNTINGIFKAHFYSIETPASYPFRHYRQIVVDNAGKLTVWDYRESKKTHVFHDKDVLKFASLHDLKLGPNKDSLNSIFSVLILCSSGGECFTQPETPILMESKERSISFKFDDADARDKFRTAFNRCWNHQKSKNRINFKNA